MIMTIQNKIRVSYNLYQNAPEGLTLNNPTQGTLCGVKCTPPSNPRLGETRPIIVACLWHAILCVVVLFLPTLPCGVIESTCLRHVLLDTFFVVNAHFKNNQLVCHKNLI